MRGPRLFARRSRATDEGTVIRLIASWCLSYPDDEVLGRVDLMRAALAEMDDPQTPHLLRQITDHLANGDPAALRREYIELFDLSKRHTLYLS